MTRPTTLLRARVIRADGRIENLSRVPTEESACAILGVFHVDTIELSDEEHLFVVSGALTAGARLNRVASRLAVDIGVPLIAGDCVHVYVIR